MVVVCFWIYFPNTFLKLSFFSVELGDALWCFLNPEYVFGSWIKVTDIDFGSIFSIPDNYEGVEVIKGYEALQKYLEVFYEDGSD